MNVELQVKFSFEIPDGVQINPEKLFIDILPKSISLYEDSHGPRGVEIPSISARLIGFDTVEAYEV